MSTNLSDPCSVYLLEDGLELWLTVLQNTKEPNDRIFALVGNIPPLLGEPFPTACVLNPVMGFLGRAIGPIIKCNATRPDNSAGCWAQIFESAADTLTHTFGLRKNI